MVKSKPTQPGTSEPLISRLRVALLDLGLDAVVPVGWVRPTCDGLSFGELTHRQANRLVKAFEDLALEQMADVPEPGPDQLRLF
jgi:hypothetical protein